MKDRAMKITVYEQNAVSREQEPVTVGVPCAKGWLNKNEAIQLLDNTGAIISSQVAPLAFWGDGTVKWMLLDFVVSITRNSVTTLTLKKCNDPESKDGVTVEIVEKGIKVNSGIAEFYVKTDCFALLSKIAFEKESVLDSKQQCILVDQNDAEYRPIVSDSTVEVNGPLRTVVKLNGKFSKEEKKICNFEVRLHFYSGKSYVKIDFTLINLNPSQHMGGLWDLGDPGSVLFKDLSLYFKLPGDTPGKISFCSESNETMKDVTGDHLEIYQDSSGGVNWQSETHLNSKGEIPVSFNGYKITIDKHEKIKKQGRANPIVSLTNEQNGISAGIAHFWQNFPKAIESHDNQLVLRLFPGQYNDLYELQGGERKTHTMYLDFTGNKDALNWIHKPLRPVVPRKNYADSGAIPYMSSCSFEEDAQYDVLLKGSITGSQSFFEKREVVDEYGWRNFGEVYADHEAIGHTGEMPFVSHYNNQYDQIYGFLKEFIASGEPKWFELMDDLATHVYDIDIYHTSGDRPGYNYALHWHTNHYLEAKSCTHRSFSKGHLDKYDPQFYGGGPSMEHCYASGFMYHHFLTGDPRSRESVHGLAEWICKTMVKEDCILGVLFDVKKKLPIWKRVVAGEKIRSDRYPFTRGSGNAISALLDAFTLTHEARFLEKAEEIIRGCVHPCDTIESRNLLNAELGWSYNVLLQAFGKYLDLKNEIEQLDEMYDYTQQSLLQYARWMFNNEYPYLEKKEELEFPNETWPAQDLRKSCVFYFAAKHSNGTEREKFLNKALYFHKYTIQKINEFDTKLLARPIALIMQNRWMYSYFSEHPESSCHIISQPQKFIRQDEFWTKLSILKYLTGSAIHSLKRFSLKNERHWLDCRRCKHA